jgi:putative tryptophan/tyrosine transport system substrate-binding protein
VVKLSTILITVALLACGVIAEAQQSKKIPLIGYLSVSNATSDSARADGIRLALRDRGYVEGKNIAIEYRYGQGKPEKYPELAAELVRHKVDVILVAGADSAIRAAMNATKIIPIVMTGAGLDPVQAGYVQSLAQPGGNVTGITNQQRDLGGKRLELLKEAVPKLARVAVLYESDTADNALDVKEVLPAAARELKLTIEPWSLRAMDDVDKVFTAISKSHPDALYPSNRSPLMAAIEKQILSFTLKNRLPAIYADERPVVVGGLMSYGPDDSERYRRIAYFVDRILKGTKPADLPVEQPTKFEFVINLKTAKQIGLEIPQWTLMKADRVIK